MDIWKKNTANLPSLVMQFVKFGLVGVANNLIFLAVYYLVVMVNSELYLLANVLGFLVSTMNAYLLNSRFVFRQTDGKGSSKQALLKTYLTYTLSLCISTGLLFLLVDIWGLSEKIAPLISLMITVPLNFVLNKLWVYSAQKNLSQREEK